MPVNLKGVNATSRYSQSIELTASMERGYDVLGSPLFPLLLSSNIRSWEVVFPDDGLQGLCVRNKTAVLRAHREKVLVCRTII